MTNEMPAVVEQRGTSYVLVYDDGRTLELPGYGRGEDLDLDPRIDLSKPVWEQVQRIQAGEHPRRTGGAA